MSTITQIEDALIDAVKDLNLFRVVDSLGRKSPPVVTNYPAAFLYYFGDKSDTSVPRPIAERVFEALVANKNLQTEAKAAANTYSLLEAVRDAINGKRLGLTDIEPFTCVAIDIADYADGIISYLMRFQTRQYMPVQTE